jgi:4-amino-4-deoxy-L-arabinose transferase-like glycosyltransferase
MFSTSNNRLGHYTLLLGLGVFMFFVNLGGPQLWDVDEGRNATAALEMMESGNWIVPTFNGQLRTDKPALLYWLQIFAYRTFGVNEFAARLPSALAALLTVLLAYELARSLFSPVTGLLTGVIVSTCLMQCVAGRFANPDALLNLCTVLTFFLFWQHFSRTGKYPFVLCGLAMGFAMLAKGPVGLVLPLGVLVLFLLWIGQVKLLLRPRLLLGIIAFCLVALPWYVLVCVETKAEFLRGFLLKHNVDRYMNTMESHDGGPGFYLLTILVGFAPWSIFFGLALWYGFWSAVKKPWPRFQALWNAAIDNDSTPLSETGSSLNRYRFLWCWIGLYFLFFTFAATKLPNYVLPITTPLAILTARMLERWQAKWIHPPLWTMRLSLGCLALVGLIAGVGCLAASGILLSPGQRFLPFVGLEYWALIGLVPLAGALAGWFLANKQKRTQMVSVVSVSAVLFLGPILAWAAEVLNQHKAPFGLVAESGAFQPENDIRIVCHQMNDLPSLNFYSQRTILHCPSERDAMAWIQNSVPVYLFMPEPTWNQFRNRLPAPYRLVAKHSDMYQRWNIVVITNQ